MTNPNIEYITGPMWRLWTDRPYETWKLSGIYADKPGYHNTVLANQKKWPDNYSVRLALDLVPENRNKARAIDLTMSDSEMVLWTRRMKAAAENPIDNRLAAVREFYGTLDNKTVFGLSKQNMAGPWKRVTANLTHLWHGHTSIFTAFVNNWSMLSPLLSVWAGESFLDWSKGSMSLPKKGDSGEEVRYWQYVHNLVRTTVTPASPLLSPDGDYGDLMAAALLDFWKKSGGVGGAYRGTYLTGWLGSRYHLAFAALTKPDTQLDPEQIKTAVTAYLDEKLPDALMLTADLKGRVTWS